MMPEAVLAICAILGLGLVYLGLRRLRRRHFLSASLQGSLGLVLVAVSALGVGLLLNLYTYHRLTAEIPIAELRFEQLGPRFFQVYLTRPERETLSFNVRGDEWQVDARILKWHGYANLLGLDARYRLERLSGRYRHIQQERQEPRTVYPLGKDRGLDIWETAHEYPRWFPWVDAIYGSAAYLPMADKAQFSLRHTQSGLVARPVNPAAQTAVDNW